MNFRNIIISFLLLLPSQVLAAPPVISRDSAPQKPVNIPVNINIPKPDTTPNINTNTVIERATQIKELLTTSRAVIQDSTLLPDDFKTILEQKVTEEADWINTKVDAYQNADNDAERATIKVDLLEHAAATREARKQELVEYLKLPTKPDFDQLYKFSEFSTQYIDSSLIEDYTAKIENIHTLYGQLEETIDYDTYNEYTESLQELQQDTVALQAELNSIMSQ